MEKIISFIKKQKIIILLILILLILIGLKFLLRRPESQTEQKTPSPLEKEEEFSPPETIASPKTRPPLDKKENIPYDPVGEALKEALKERPWLLDLPIKDKNYIIDYFENKQSFRVLMKIDITSPLSREQQIANIKAEAPKKIEAIGVDLNKEKIYYTFTP